MSISYGRSSDNAVPSFVFLSMVNGKKEEISCFVDRSPSLRCTSGLVDSLQGMDGINFMLKLNEGG